MELARMGGTDGGGALMGGAQIGGGVGAPHPCGTVQWGGGGHQDQRRPHRWGGEGGKREGGKGGRRGRIINSIKSTNRGAPLFGGGSRPPAPPRPVIPGRCAAPRTAPRWRRCCGGGAPGWGGRGGRGGRRRWGGGRPRGSRAAAGSRRTPGSRSAARRTAPCGRARPEPQRLRRTAGQRHSPRGHHAAPQLLWPPHSSYGHPITPMAAPQLLWPPHNSYGRPTAPMATP